MPRHTNAYHNFKHELESLETKYVWFSDEKRSVYDLFADRDLLKPLRTDLDLPKYLVEQVQTIRNWYEEMKGYEEDLEQST